MRELRGRCAALLSVVAWCLSACSEKVESNVGTAHQALGEASITATPGTTQYLAGSLPLSLDPTLGIVCSSAIDGATVAITSGFLPAEDALVFSTTLGVTGTYSSAQGTLSLSGSGSAAAWEAVLRSVRYQNTAGVSATAGVRTVTFALGSGKYSPSTTHFYKMFPNEGVDWDSARVAAGTSEYFGLVGYLATITSAAEDAFVADVLGAEGWLGAMATLTPETPGNGAGDLDAVPRTWYWVTGPEAGTAFFTQQLEGSASGGGVPILSLYNGWAANEPNNDGGTEAWAYHGDDGKWRDLAYDDASVGGYLVEYGGMAGDPDVSLTATRGLEVVRQDQCTIDEVTYGQSDENPENSCQACDPGVSRTAFTAKVAGYPCESDALDCTTDSCDGSGTCGHTVYTGCLIDQACVAADTTNPSNDCQECNPAASTEAYVAKAAGVACADDGDADTLDVCNAQSECVHPLRSPCSIDGVEYASGAANPENECEACEPTVSAEAWTNRVQGFPCATDDLSCTSDVCDGSGSCGHVVYTGCLIESACVVANSEDPSNDCQECNPATSMSAYVPKAAGVFCADDGNASTLNVCSAVGACSHPLKGSCVISDAEYPGGAANPENACEFCDPVTSVEAWTRRVRGFPCATDNLNCTADTCDGAGVCAHSLYTGCLIEGACVSGAATDPSNDCQECNPASSTTAYVAKAAGVSCADDGIGSTLDVCGASAKCTHPLKGSCSIDDTEYAGGAANPKNVCEFCAPPTSEAGWTRRVEGFPCETDNLSCTSDTCDGAGVCGHSLYTGCLIAGACVAAGATDPSNECQECDPARVRDAYVAKEAGVACVDDGSATTLDVCNAAGECTHPLKGPCYIDGVEYFGGADNPDNVCQYCDPATSVDGWTSRVVGYPCETDELSCTEDVCDGAGSCEHPLSHGCMVDSACVAAGATDPRNDCRECNPSFSSGAYVAKVAGVACADDGNAGTLDVCSAEGECTHPIAGSCRIGGTDYAAGAGNPLNPCEYCDPGTSVDTWAKRVVGFPCADDALSCTSDVCDGAGVCGHPLTAGCLIDNACVAAGATDPSNECNQCDPTSSNSAYVAKVAGFPCADDGRGCTADTCDGSGACVHELVSGCLIAGECVAVGAGDPDDDSQECDPSQSTTEYSPNGSAEATNVSCEGDDDCSTGLHCNAGSCVSSLPENSRCTASTDCASGSCRDGRCRPVAFVGGCEIGRGRAPGGEGVVSLLVSVALAVGLLRRKAGGVVARSAGCLPPRPRQISREA